MSVRIAIKEIFTPYDNRDIATLYHTIEHMTETDEYYISSAFYDFEDGLEDILVVSTIKTNGNNLPYVIDRISKDKDLLRSLYFCGIVRCV